MNNWKKDIPSLNALDNEWKKYWNSCSIGELVGTLERIIQMNRKRKPMENKFLYIRALECRDALSKTVRDLVNKNNKLIRDIDWGKSRSSA